MIKDVKIGLAAITLIIFALGSTAFATSSLTQTTTINATISPILSVLTTSGTVSLSTTPSAAGVQTMASDTVTVSTNDVSGYNLTMSDVDATTTMVSGANTIPASSGTPAVPAVQTVNTWGYAVAGGNFSASGYAAGSSTISGTLKFAGVPPLSTPTTLKTTATTATNDTTTVWYSLAVNTSQPTGNYTDSVTYTATCN